MSQNLPSPPPGVLGGVPPRATVETVPSTPPPRGALDIHPKVMSTAVVAALLTLILWVLSATGHSAPPEVAAALVTVFGAGAGYLTPGGP